MTICNELFVTRVHRSFIITERSLLYICYSKANHPEPGLLIAACRPGLLPAWPVVSCGSSAYCRPPLCRTARTQPHLMVVPLVKSVFSSVDWQWMGEAAAAAAGLQTGQYYDCVWQNRLAAKPAVRPAPHWRLPSVSLLCSGQTAGPISMLCSTILFYAFQVILLTEVVVTAVPLH